MAAPEPDAPKGTRRARNRPSFRRCRRLSPAVRCLGSSAGSSPRVDRRSRLVAAVISCFVVLVRFMSQQMTRKTERRAEDMYDEFSSDRKDKDRYPI